MGVCITRIGRGRASPRIGMNVMGRWTHARGAVLRCGQGGDRRRSGASFGARAGAAGGTHNTGCRARFRMLFGRRWRPPALAPVAAPHVIALRGEATGALNVAIWETSAVSIARFRKQWGALVILGISGCALAACSSQAASTTSTTRAGTGFIAVTSRPPPTAAQSSKLVKKGCSSLPGVPAAVASSAATYSHDPSSALMTLYHGPWYSVASMSETGTEPSFRHIAADAETLFLATLASLKSGNLAGVATSEAKVTRDCKALHQAIG